MQPLQHFSLQSKLIAALLFVSLLAIGAITYSSYRIARQAAIDAANRQLTALRITKAGLIQVMLSNYRDQVISYALSRTAMESIKAFAGGLEELDTQPLTSAEQAELEQFYQKTFVPGLEKIVGVKAELRTLMPAEPGTRRLQLSYIVRNPNPYQKGQLYDPQDETGAYAAAHKRFHGIYRQIAERVGVEDILLVEAKTGRVIYSFQKSVELGTNLFDGPHANTNLGAAVRSMLKANDRNAFQISDFERYRPNLGSPGGFLCAPVFEGAVPIGVVAYEMPLDNITRVMTADFKWERAGLGETGEVYLVGPDHLMRTRSRFMYEDTDGFLKHARESGLPDAVTKQMERQRSEILALPVNTLTASAGLAGREGVTEVPDYRGVPVVSSYGPLDFENIRWAVLAEMDTSEAYGPVASMGRQAAATAAGLSIVVSLLAMGLSSFVTRPVKVLTGAARRVTAGEIDVQVSINSKDEFRELADAFNQMTRSLKQKTDQLENTLRANEELLLNILPPQAAAHFREGDEQPLQTFADVTVLFADIVGLERAACGEKQGLTWLHQLVIAFDEAADRHGIEKLKTMGASYLAAGGLSVPRPDHPQRAVEFADELLRIVDLFNRSHECNLEIDIGINAGSVTGGVVGRRKFIYDLWGETVTLARYMQVDDVSCIRVTETIYHRLRDQYRFERQPDVRTKSGALLPVYLFTGPAATQEPAPWAKSEA
jgi:class 3 adenylate cyclase